MAQINLSNDIMFHLVMRDPERCRKFLEMVLGFEIAKVEVEAQKDITPSLIGKGIRLDIYAKDENNTRYNVEMQTTHSYSLGLRLRYYQSSMDYNVLERGNRYEQLPSSFIIFICTKDPFKRGKCRYTIRPTCLETGELVETRQEWILLNAEGTDKNVSDEIAEFLQYVKDSTSENAGNPLLQDINKAVTEFRENREWRDAMITFEEKLRWMEEDIRQEGYQEGHQEGHQEGRQEGRQEANQEHTLKLISKICRKLAQDKDAATIAEELDEDKGWICSIVHVAQLFAPDYDAKKIYEKLNQ